MASDEGERPPIESLAIEEQEIEPEGKGHLDADERVYSEELKDTKGDNGPSYEAHQAKRGKEIRPGGSSDPHDSLSHADEARKP